MGKDQLLGGCSLFLLLFCLLPGGGSTTTPEPQYLVLVPFLIHTETPEKVCVQLNHLNESVTLSITLEHGAQNESLTQEKVDQKEAFKCVSFQIPKQSGPPEALLTVLVKGPTLQFWSRKQVLLKDKENLVFVQTDKPIYKPGQTVNFRIASLSEDFKPVNEQIPLVYIRDPQRNRLAQWRDVALQTGLTQQSFPLTSEPAKGRYTVMVQTASGKTVEHPFEVQEYVLPKFEVTLKAPKIITIEAQELEVTACGVYTYGKPVPGQVNIHVCRRYSDYGYGSCRGANPETLCEDFSGQADAQGCFSQVVRTKIFQLKRERYAMSLLLTGTVTEEGTGVEMAGTGEVAITSTLSIVQLERLDSHYKPGIPLFGQVRLVDGTQKPLDNQTLQVFVGEARQSTNYTTDAQGRVHFSIDTANFTTEVINIQATYKLGASCYDRNWIQPVHQQLFHTVPRFYSPSQSYLSIQPVPGTLPCGQPQPVQVHYVLRPGVVEEKRLSFTYLVLAKGGIVQTGTHVLALEGEAKGVFSLDLAVGPDVAPLARLLLYAILPSGELLLHSADFTIENCFRHKVTLRFSEPEGLPGSQAHLRLSASQGSLCGVHAVDKSVFLLKPEAELSPKTVYDLLPVKNLQGYFYKSHNLDEPNINPCITLKNVVVDGFLYSAVPLHSREGDAYSILKGLGLKVFTSAKIHKPEICPVFQSESRVYEVHSMDYNYPTSTRLASAPMASLDRGGPGPGAPLPVVGTMETVRMSFPETWLWELERVGPPETEAELPVTVPDTITEWKAGAFCLSEEAGFGLAESTVLRAFQPFFLHLTLPYSVVRGEAFVLKGTVFSYLQGCIRVRVALAPSADFEASPVGAVEESACLCQSGRKTLSWRVTPKALGHVKLTASAEALTSSELCGNEIVETPQQGRKDTVIKELLVEPEGEEKEAVFSSLLCTEEQAQLAPVSLRLPPNVVEGSARASFCVLGDLLGSAIQNLHQLLRLPYGCGEQNMALLAPNIYILDYLNKTGQLTEEVRSKAVGYLTTGYQRQLNYKHADGSYSTFGEQKHSPGNTWLTAFVLKTFGEARRYIYVDENHITGAWIALAARQKENGCFRGTGTLLNNALMGGVDNDDEDFLSLYITISLLENHQTVTNSVVRNAMFCMETMAQANKTSPYARALLAYAFSLAGKEGKRAELLHTLQAEAVKDADGSIHWQQPQKEAEAAPRPFYRPRAPSAEVELAAYVLLALLSKQPSPSPEELTAATGIVKWLSKQQNPMGGFSSTQDTVVALQALALYSSLTYKPGAAGATVTLRSGESALRPFQVDSANRLLLQCQPLPAVPGEYSPAVTGTGCVYMQTALRYNVHPRLDDAHFALEVHTAPQSCSGAKAHRTFDIAISVSYTGQRPVSNMAIVDVKMLSGFVPVKPSVQKLREAGSLVKRTEVTPSHVLLYLEQVSNVTQSFSFAVELDVPVQGLKPAVVKVYDYYVTDESAVAQYSAPCSAEGSKQGNA